MDKGKAVASSSGPSRHRAAHDREADAAIQRRTAAGVEDEGQSSCWRSTISRNCLKFVESRLPRRVMYCSGGRWVDFPEDATSSVVDAFRARRTAVDIMIGGSIYIVDLLNMILIDLSGGLHRSVAWMDELGKFYFPEKDCTPCRGKTELEPATDDSKASNPRSAKEGTLEAAEEGGENVATAPSGGGEDAGFNAPENERIELSHQAEDYLLARLSANPENVGPSTASSVPREPRLPASSWLPFPMLLKALESQVSPVVNEMLQSYFNLFQEKKISRKEMIDRLRMLVGDALIRSILNRYYFSA